MKKTLIERMNESARHGEPVSVGLILSLGRMYRLRGVANYEEISRRIKGSLPFPEYLHTYHRIIRAS